MPQMTTAPICSGSMKKRLSKWKLKVIQSSLHYSCLIIHLLDTYCIAAWFWIFTSANLRLRCRTCHFGRVELPLRSKGFALAVLTQSLHVLHAFIFVLGGWNLTNDNSLSNCFSTHTGSTDTIMLIFVPGGWNLTDHTSLHHFSLLYASLSLMSAQAGWKRYLLPSRTQ